MPAGDEYRVKAADMQAKAHEEANSRLRAQLEGLALSYLRLADQADINALNYVVNETPPSKPGVQQQQQQPQPTKKEGDD